MNLRDAEEETPLHKAVEHGDDTMFECLLNHGADPNVRGGDEWGLCTKLDLVDRVSLRC